MAVRNKARQHKQQSEVVIVVYVVVLSFLDDNINNRDNLSANEGNHVVYVVLVVVSYTICCRTLSYSLSCYLITGNRANDYCTLCAKREFCVQQRERPPPHK